MRLRITLICMIALTANLSALAEEPKTEHPGTITGIVISADTSEPVSGAYVGTGDFGDSGGSNHSRHRNQGLLSTAKTDAKGRFTLKNVKLNFNHPLVVTHTDFVRSDTKVNVTTDSPNQKVTISLIPAAKIKATIIDIQGKPLIKHWIMRLESLDGYQFIPPGSNRDRHLSSFASSIWTENLLKEPSFTFTELKPGKYLVEAISFDAKIERSPQGITGIKIDPNATTYHGSETIAVESGKTYDLKIDQQQNNTTLTINIPDSPINNPSIPNIVLVSRNPALLLYDDGLAHGPEHPYLGRITKQQLYKTMFIGQDIRKFKINNLPPADYSVFAGPAFFMSSAKAKLTKNRETIVNIPPIKPIAQSKLYPHKFNNNVTIEQPTLTVSQACDLINKTTNENPKVTPDPEIENRKLKFAPETLQIWGVLESIYLQTGCKLQEQKNKTYKLYSPE